MKAPLYEDIAPIVMYDDYGSRRMASFEECVEYNAVIIERIEKGFADAFKSLNVEGCEIIHKNRKLYDDSVVTYLKITLPDVTFGECVFRRNYFKINAIAEQRSISLRLHSDSNHPHTSDSGSFCWDNGLAVIEMIEALNFEAALMNLINAINSYYPGSAYRIPLHSIPCSIPGCTGWGSEIDPKFDHIPTPHSGQYVCKLHASVCSLHGCGKPAMKNIDGYLVCLDHVKVRCPLCKKEFALHFFNKSQETSRTYRILWCKDCSFNCAGCGATKLRVNPHDEFCHLCLAPALARKIFGARSIPDAKEIIRCQTNPNPMFVHQEA